MSDEGINEVGGRDGGYEVPMGSEIHSAAPKGGGSGRKILVFRTAREVSAVTPDIVPWIAAPWVAREAITEVVGKVKLAGKTTFISSLVASVLDGRDFLGQPTAKTSVMWLTEQSPTTFREVLRRAGLLDRDDLAILFWHETLGVPWESVVGAAREEAQRRGADLLVVDTLGQFAGLKGDSENSSGDALAAIAPLQVAAAAGLAVIVIRHERKGGGDVGDSGRGSSAFAGAVDIVVALRRTEGNQRPTIRQIYALSRFDETPPALVIELTGDGYIALGTEDDVSRQQARRALLGKAPTEETQAIGFADLIGLLGGLKRTVVQGALAELVAEGVVKKVGAGKKGNPYRYFRPLPDEGSETHPEDSFRRNSYSKGGGMNPDAHEAGGPGVGLSTIQPREGA